MWGLYRGDVGVKRGYVGFAQKRIKWNSKWNMKWTLGAVRELALIYRRRGIKSAMWFVFTGNLGAAHLFWGVAM